MFLLLSMATAHAAVAESRDVHRITVHAGAHDRVDAVVAIELPATLHGEAPLQLVRQNDRRTILSQRDGEQRLVFRLKTPLRANTERVYRVETAPPERAAPPVVGVLRNEKTIEVSFDKKPALAYHIAKTTPPDGIDSIYSSSGYIHPLRTPAGRVVTDAYPPDHAHQHALFASWPRTKIDGERIDFWNQHKRLGFTGHHKVIDDSFITGPLFGEFTVVREYVSTITDKPREPTVCMLETWRVRTWQHPRGLVVDVHSKLTPTTRKVEFPAYHYGGMAIRGARQWTAGVGAMLTSEGDNRIRGNATNAKWFTLSGPDTSGKSKCGVALLSYPGNGIQYTRLHPSMPYGCFLPVVNKGMELAPGKSYETSWRYIAYDGSPQPRLLDAMWRNWADPPTAVWEVVLDDDPKSEDATELSKEQEVLLNTFRKEFIEITPGKGKFPAKFTLGDKNVAANPPREVTFEKPFAIAAYETTQNLYRAVMGENPSRWKGERNSVEVLSRTDAEKFCTLATKMMRQAKLIDADQEIRLPTEDEWEYTARAGTRTAYSFGDTAKELDAYAWHTGNAAGNDPPVGAKKPNPWGLYDVHGYLWEWCSNSYAEGRANGVIRSGSWKDAAPLLRSAVRQETAIDFKDDAVGFRCVLSRK